MKNKQMQHILEGFDKLIKMKKRNPHKKFGLSDDDLAIYDTESWNKIHSKDEKRK